MQTQILEALAKLDIENNDHWTSEGMPRLDVVKELSGLSVSRADITAAAKGFTRANPLVEVPAEQGEAPAPAEQVAPVAPVVAEQGEAPAPAELSEDEEVEAELEAAQAEMAQCQRRLSEAHKAMDVVIDRRAKEEAHVTTTHSIKAYQKSQFEQRAREANVQAVMVEAAKAKL